MHKRTTFVGTLWVHYAEQHKSCIKPWHKNAIFIQIDKIEYRFEKKKNNTFLNEQRRCVGWRKLSALVHMKSSWLTGNAGHQFEGPQYSDGPEGSQVEIWTHSGQDPKGNETNPQKWAQAINI